MKKLITILIFILLIMPLALKAYSIAAPTNLQASITGTKTKPTVHLEWQGEIGLNYLIAKKFPDGRIVKTSLMSSIVDPECIMAGGVYVDPLVKNGQTYEYKIWTFDSSYNYSSPATINVTINAGETMGCLGWEKLSLSAETSNFSIVLNWNNPENKKFDIYVDGKLKGRTKKGSVTLWPVFGKTHQVTVKATNPENTNVLISYAKACVSKTSEEKIIIEKNYFGILSKSAELIDGLFTK